ncbi:MAG: hypothetical protein WCK35_28525 [Chloroflexota bacterium]
MKPQLVFVGDDESDINRERFDWKKKNIAVFRRKNDGVCLLYVFIGKQRDVVWHCGYYDSLQEVLNYLTENYKE